MSRLDPKPGRWILPLAVLGIVAFTWVFVNALPPAEQEALEPGRPAATSTEAPPPDATTTTEAPGPEATTTTTTTPPEVAAFLNAAETVATEAADLLAEAEEVNATWEDGRNFTLALNSLRDLAARAADFSESVDDTSVPDGFEDLWTPVQEAAVAMASAADEMVTGLQAPDTGQIRRAALADFGQAAGDLAASVASLAAQLG
jgi:hypothetical protein